MKTIIMAGGRGTRISERFPDIPKPLIPINGVPVLEREICSLRDQGFTDLILTISHMGDKIRDHFGDGSRLGNGSVREEPDHQPLVRVVVEGLAADEVTPSAVRTFPDEKGTVLDPVFQFGLTGDVDSAVGFNFGAPATGRAGCLNEVFHGYFRLSIQTQSRYISQPQPRNSTTWTQ